MNLCDICIREYGRCMNEHENLPTIEYGNDGQYNDAVLECDWFIEKPKLSEQINMIK